MGFLIGLRRTYSKSPEVREACVGTFWEPEQPELKASITRAFCPPSLLGCWAATSRSRPASRVNIGFCTSANSLHTSLSLLYSSACGCKTSDPIGKNCNAEHRLQVPVIFKHLHYNHSSGRKHRRLRPTNITACGPHWAHRCLICGPPKVFSTLASAVSQFTALKSSSTLLCFATRRARLP